MSCTCAKPEPALIDHGLNSLCEKCGQLVGPQASKTESLDTAIEYYAKHANGQGGTAWMNPATVLETLTLLRELKQMREDWETICAAADAMPPDETQGKPWCPTCEGEHVPGDKSYGCVAPPPETPADPTGDWPLRVFTPLPPDEAQSLRDYGVDDSGDSSEKSTDCPHKTDAPKDAPPDPDCTWCQSAVKS